jgi:hypothetical protein
MQRLNWRFGGALVVAGAFALTLGTNFGPKGSVSAQQVATPPPPVTPTPAASAPPSALPVTPPSAAPATATPAPRRGRGRTKSTPATAQPDATATPTSPAFSTLDGNWEVQVQRIDTTLYSHLTMKQDGAAVSGTWFVQGKKIPIEGTYDGRLFHFVAKDAAGDLDMSGYVENATDMVGIVDNGKGNLPNANPLAFTAEHRGNTKSAYPAKDKKNPY